MRNLSWKRLATFGLGGAMTVAGLLIPGAQALVPVGVGIVGWATKWPGDRTKRDQQEANARERAARTRNDDGPPPSR